MKTVAEVQAAAAEAAFGHPIITNVLRGLVVEAMIACALQPEWQWCGQDYSSWDFQRPDGLRLEVKQSAARQSWARAGGKPSAGTFDIAARTGRWDGPEWISKSCRWSHIYVFAHHCLMSEAADHRDPSQWTFYVVPENRLPHQKQLAFGKIRALASACDYDQLHSAVEATAAAVLAAGIGALGSPANSTASDGLSSTTA